MEAVQNARPGRKGEMSYGDGWAAARIAKAIVYNVLQKD